MESENDRNHEEQYLRQEAIEVVSSQFVSGPANVHTLFQMAITQMTDTSFV